MKYAIGIDTEDCKNTMFYTKSHTLGVLDRAKVFDTESEATKFAKRRHLPLLEGPTNEFNNTRTKFSIFIIPEE